MSKEELFLELGDIIEISAPSNSIIDNHIYIIDYLDDKIMMLIDDTTLEKITINIDEDGKLSDESIQSIAILNKSEKKGFARQNNLLVNNWISIYIAGDIPTIITGQISNLEEDMIEVTTWPDMEKIYIDFGYQGLPQNIPFEKIVLRESPGKLTLKEGEESILEGEEEEEEEEEVEIRLKKVLLEGDEIQFGEELEEITEVVNVPIEERRYDIETQKNDFLDDLLSSVPVTYRTKTIINGFHIMIERYIELREKFSSFDEYGLPISKKNIDIKPLINKLQSFRTKLSWILPIVKNKRKIYYDIDDEEDEYPDVIKENLLNDIENILKLYQEYEEGNVPDTLNGYNYLIRELNSYHTPFRTTDEKVIISKPVNIDCDTVINNYSSFKSSVGASDPMFDTTYIKEGEFVIQKYNVGLKRIEIEKMAGSQIKTNFKTLTENDNLDLDGYIFFPRSVINYSRIFLPKTNISTKINLHRYYFSYNSLLKKLESTIKEIKVDNETVLPKFFPNESINVMLLEEDEEEVTVDAEERYKKFLDIIVPSISNLLEGGHNMVSISKILYALEPFLIYEENINFENFQKIITLLRREIVVYKRKTQENKKMNERYIKYDYGTMEEKKIFLEKIGIKDVINTLNKTNKEIDSKVKALYTKRILINF